MKNSVKAAVAIAAAFVLSGCTKTLDLNKYITVETTGYDGYGTATVTFDDDKFLKDYDSVSVKSDHKDEYTMYKSLFGGSAASYILESDVFYQVDKSTGLRNGETVTLTWSCDDEAVQEYFDAKLKYSDMTYEVKDLQEVEKYDPFEHIQISFAGISGQGTVEIDADDSEPALNGVQVTADPDDDLSNGDEITVSVNLNTAADEYVTTYKKVPDPTEKTFTVYGLDEYLMDVADIPDSFFEEMNQIANDKFTSEVSGENTVAVLIEPVDGYLGVKKDGSGSRIDMIYKVVVDNISTGKETTFYNEIYYTNVAKAADGSISYDEWYRNYATTIFLDGYHVFTDGYDSADAVVREDIDQLRDSYTFTQITIPTQGE